MVTDTQVADFDRFPANGPPSQTTRQKLLGLFSFSHLSKLEPATSRPMIAHELEGDPRTLWGWFASPATH